MLYFIYTYAEKAKGGHTSKTVRIYRIKKNLPIFMGTLTDTSYVSEFQLVMMAMEQLKLLPAKSFEKNPNTGGYLHFYASGLRDSGIAEVVRVS